MASDLDGKVCDVKGCNNQATEVIPAQNADGYFTFNMCLLHFSEYRSKESIGKPFNLKGRPVRGRYN
jgi:hypothetical protein